MKKIERIPVDSSMVSAVGYDTESQDLYVEFNSGKIYCYQEVEPEVFQELLTAESVGSYMRYGIIGTYSEFPVRRGK